MVLYQDTQLGKRVHRLDFRPHLLLHQSSLVNNLHSCTWQPCFPRSDLMTWIGCAASVASSGLIAPDYAVTLPIAWMAFDRPQKRDWHCQLFQPPLWKELWPLTRARPEDTWRAPQTPIQHYSLWHYSALKAQQYYIPHLLCQCESPAYPRSFCRSWSQHPPPLCSREYTLELWGF